MTDDHFHLESLEAFERDLAEAGFGPVETANQSRWRGPIHKAFAPLTAATTMEIVIVAGWPFRPPALLVDGLDTNHSTLGGFVCMWQDGDPSREWETVAGFFSRIEGWCENAEHGWEGNDLGYDAFLNFQRKLPNVVTFDRPQLGIHKGGWGDLHGVVNRDPPRIDVGPGRASSPNHLRGLWFHTGRLSTPPPRQFSEVFRCLSRPQAKGLRRELDRRRGPRPFVPSGGLDLILFCWERQGTTDLLVMACEGMNNEVEAIALQPGPTDESSLILRAGPDAGALRSIGATLFGAGALGGHVGTALAESGLGRLDIVDGDVLLPENVVRHVAGHDQVGKPKVQAVHHVVEKHAPWTAVAEFPEAPVAPGRIRELISGADIVVDTTGNDAFVPALAMVAEELGKPLVSGALYRGGSVARVQRQVLAGDTPIHLREDGPQYPVIPGGDLHSEFATPALGCSAPVNNAPPASVMGCAALIAQVAIDALTRRFEFDDEVTDVYRPLAQAPFDRVGRVG